MFVMEFRRLPRKSSYSSNSILKPKAVVTIMQNIPVQHRGGSLLFVYIMPKKDQKKHDNIENCLSKKKLYLMEIFFWKSVSQKN